MVSADNLNLDVLEMICSHLSRPDLPSVALVSRAFLSAVIPALYSTLLFPLNHAKKYPSVSSPFSALLAHPECAVHTRKVDIRAVPKIKAQLHPGFMRDCAQALTLCSNLTSFTCVVNVLPILVESLKHKHDLHDLRINGNLNTEQAVKLLTFQKLHSLSIDSASWNVMDIFPQWSTSIRGTLTSLILYMSAEVNESVLESALEQLPRLTGLHVIGCQKIDHITLLDLVTHTPLLESLSLTASDTSRPFPETAAPLHYLQHLAIDARFSQAPNSTAASTALTSILVYVKESALSPDSGLQQFTFRMADRQNIVIHSLMHQLLDGHRQTLERLSFVNCTVGLDSISLICRRCKKLTRLELAVPVKELTSFIHSIARSSTLHTIIDMADTHVNHIPQKSLSSDDIRTIMRLVKNVHVFVSDIRVWTTHKNENGESGVKLNRQRLHNKPRWFQPLVDLQ